MALPTTFGIVGAGPAGLLAARAFIRLGLEVELLERHSGPGGLWDMNNPGTPMYSTCNFISNRDYGGFIGYPMPAEYPLFPRWDQIRDYIRGFSDAFGITPLVVTGADVVRATPVDSPEGRFWRVSLSDGSQRDYRGIVAATGGQWQPWLPEYPGMEDFAGDVIHSAQYTAPETFHGERVLVIGAGNSGVDIASDAAAHAERAFISTRRGYWFLPKLHDGVPSAALLSGDLTPAPDSPLHGKSLQEIQDVVLGSVGDLRNYGLPQPDHQFGATHPILNDQMLHYMSHGLLAWKPDVVAFDADGVRFADGTREDVDIIVMATGYSAPIPWLPEGILTYDGGFPRSILGALVEGQEGLYLAGALHFSGNTFPVFDQLVQLAAHDARALVTGQNADNLRYIRESYRPDLNGDASYVATRRNSNQVQVSALHKVFAELHSRFGISVPGLVDHDFYRGQLTTNTAQAVAA
ncbi:NAD(P)-binding domain-containing protein [Arthrobacter sp.]|uniref:flavin-containing monooxygenase n=1 Tax=Arthrobacter sp. TaxID=1667 RepID=UPI002811E484|nr:NAD(P)-binding domain-containing protein [Arthrobacter sp.]